MSCTVIPSRRWRNAVTDQAASLYGACPWTSDADKANWQIEESGFTIQNPDGTIGCGKPPCATREEAQALADRLNARNFSGMNQG